MPELRDQPSREPLFGVPDLPERALETYARLWQLETWLRQMVYVQLRAQLGDTWDVDLRRALSSRNNDKRLVHMPTAEESLLSYAQLSDLTRLIGDNWQLFESYLPPQSIWNAKLEEVSQIRHRVAHFRSTHEDDLGRVMQLLRDLDDGFWRFCSSYNDPRPTLPASDDPVVAAFLHLDPFPWTDVGGRWARIGHASESDRFNVTVEVLTMPWAQWTPPFAGKPGFLYDATFQARRPRRLDFARLLSSTRSRHKHLAHICLDSVGNAFRFTVPSCLGKDMVIELVTALHEAALNALGPEPDVIDDDRVQRLADSWPEYVLGPRNPLTFLSPDTPCTFFGA
jgi:hypothetical protein